MRANPPGTGGGAVARGVNWGRAMSPPVQWASTLASLVLSRHATPAQRLDTLHAAGPAIARIVAHLPMAGDGDVAQALICLAQAAEAAGPEGIRIAAAHLIGPVRSTDARALAKGLTVAIADGAGTQLGVALATGLRAWGDVERAEVLEQAIADGMRQVHQAFVRATRTVRKLEAGLAGLPPEQQSAAKKKNSGKYAAAANAAKLVGLTAQAASTVAGDVGRLVALQRASGQVLRSSEVPTTWD